MSEGQVVETIGNGEKQVVHGYGVCRCPCEGYAKIIGWKGDLGYT
jgi:hypothetical protein